MAKKKKKTKKSLRKRKPEAVEDNDLLQRAEDYTADAYKEYGMYVNMQRAIPDLRDGLKPVQRRVLYEMYHQRVLPSSNFKKCAAIVGGAMANWHPHGDSAIYDALVNIVNPTPIVMSSDGGHPFSPISPQGNFGAPPRRHHPPAASRYTEARLSKLGAMLFECADVAEMRPNYNGEKEEPVVIPVRIPYLLLFGSEGIGVGAATKIPRHGLDAVLKATAYVLKKGSKAKLSGVVKRLQGPDYGHSYCTSDEDELMDMYREGHGTIRFMSTFFVRRGKDSHELVITSFAPGMNVDRLLRELGDLADEKKILAFNNETAAEGPRITIQFRDPMVIEERVLRLLKSSMSYSWNVIDSTDPDNPRFMRVDLMTYLNTWLDWRREVETAMLELEQEREQVKLSREQARLAASQNAAKLGAIMGSRRSYESKKKAIAKEVTFTWMKPTGKGSKTKKTTERLTDEQVEYLLDQKIRSMDRLNAAKLEEGIDAIVATLVRIADDLQHIDRVIYRHLGRIRKQFGKAIKDWTGTIQAGGEPAIELPEGETAAGFWHFTPKGFCSAMDKLSTRRGKMKEGFLCPATEEVTIVEAEGEAYTRKSVFLSHGKTDFDNIVGVVPSSLPVMMVMDEKGSVALTEHPWHKSEYEPLATEHALVEAWGCRDSDVIYAFGSNGKWESHKVEKLGTKRPNCKGLKLIKGTRTKPRVYVVPKGGCLVANGHGRVQPDEVTTDMAVFAVGKKNYIVTAGRREKVIASARQAASWASTDGLEVCIPLR